MTNRFSHRRARILVSTMAATMQTPQTHGFHSFLTPSRKLRPKFLKKRTPDQHWRTSTSLATSSPLSPLHESLPEELVTNSRHEAPLPPPRPFPRWIRLKASADVAERQELTALVADAISASGGFLSQTNTLSDMVTVFVLEDVDPEKLQAFQNRLDSIVRLDPTSRAILGECQALLNRSRQEQQSIPDTTMAVLQLNWKNASGTLRQEIPMVG